MTTTYYYVTAFDNARTGWTKYGSSPYLSVIDYPTNYIAISDVTDVETGDYDFADSGAENSEIIDSVTIEIYRYDKLNAPGDVYVYVWNGSAWIYVGGFEISNAVWSWKSLDVSAVLNSWAKIDSARLYLRGTADELCLTRIDCARIKVVSHAAAVFASKRLLVGVGV